MSAIYTISTEKVTSPLSEDSYDRPETELVVAAGAPNGSRLVPVVLGRASSFLVTLCAVVSCWNVPLLPLPRVLPLLRLLLPRCRRLLPRLLLQGPLRVP